MRAYRDVVRRAVAEFDGAEIKTEGDSFYVVFGSPSAALKCGLRILELAAESQASAGGAIPVGVGVHVGETVAMDDGFVGSAVNVAARVCAQAAAGELLVTDAVRSLTRTYLDVTFLPRGRKRLKGISEPIGLYRVRPGGDVGGVSRWHRVASRWPILAAALTTVMLIVVTALVGGALVREAAGGPGPSQTQVLDATAGEPSGSSAASPGIQATYPTAAETRLLGLLAEGDRDRCQRADPADRPVLGVERAPGELTVVHRSPFEAGIECGLGGISAPDRLWLWELQPAVPAPNPDPAHIAIAAHGGLVDATPGTCRDEYPAIETWAFGDVGGTLVCHETNTGDAVLLWVYDDETRLFARALRDDKDMDALLAWWEAVGRFAAP
ncbi:MAG: hypothetical protein QOI85_1835 [Chloroflexota bacterium]|nr:hypothetical protein [Chloroflexota bacterium]